MRLSFSSSSGCRMAIGVSVVSQRSQASRSGRITGIASGWIGSTTPLGWQVKKAKSRNQSAQDGSRETLSKDGQRPIVAGRASGQSADADAPGIKSLPSDSAKTLKRLVNRIRRIMSERKALSDDIKLVFDEVKSSGFDKKAVRRVIKLMDQPVHQRREDEEFLEAYKRALGMD